MNELRELTEPENICDKKQNKFEIHAYADRKW